MLAHMWSRCGFLNWSWANLNEAPLHWLAALNLVPLQRLTTCCCIGLLFLALNACIQGAWGLAACCLAACVLLVVPTRYACSPEQVERYWLCSLIFVACLVTWGPYFASEAIYRHRAMGMNFILWRSCLPFLGLRSKASAVFLLVTGLNECIATWVIFTRFGEVVPLRIYGVTIVCSLLYEAVVMKQHRWWRSLYDAESQLKSEAEAMESLLFMVSDASVWLCADGDTVFRSNKRFDSIIGKEMMGCRFSDSMPDDERERLRRTLRDMPHQSPVTLFPTTMDLQGSVSSKVDLFIVDRRKAFANSAAQLDDVAFGSSSSHASMQGLLIGLRACDAGTLCTLPDSEEIIEAVDSSCEDKLRSLSARDDQTSAIESLEQGCAFESGTVNVSFESSCKEINAGAAATGIPLSGSTQVLCRNEDGSRSSRSVDSIASGMTLVCHNCRTSQTCDVRVREVASLQRFAVSYTVRLQVGEAHEKVSRDAVADTPFLLHEETRLLVQMPQALHPRFHPVDRLVDIPSASVCGASCVGGSVTSNTLTETWFEVSSSNLDAAACSNNWFTVNLDGDSRYALLALVEPFSEQRMRESSATMAASNFIYVSRRRRVHFSCVDPTCSDVGSQSGNSSSIGSVPPSAADVAPRGILRAAPATAASADVEPAAAEIGNACAGPRAGSPYVASNDYLKECSKGLLHDLVTSWNFRERGCCTWHASVQRLAGMVDEMRDWHACGEQWCPEAVWQCSNCGALQGLDQGTQACWICEVDRDVEAEPDERETSE